VIGYLGRVLLSVVAAVVLGALLVAVTVLAAGAGAPRVVVVPDVEGLPLEAARDLVEKAGLELVVGGRVYSNRVDEGHVVRTRPYPGKRVKSGRRVDTLISRGPREIKVPVLIGLRLRDAEKRIIAAHLTVGVVSQRASTAPAGQVLEQYPRAGKVAARGESVNLVASGGKSFGVWEDPGGRLHVFRRVRVTVPEPEPVQRVRVVSSYHGRKTSVYDRVHQPGDEVVVDVSGRPGSKVQVFLRDKLVFEAEL